MRTQQAKLTPNDGDREDQFGESVAVSSDGTTAIIGAYHDEDPNGENAGSVYVFEASNGTWTQQAKLFAEDGDSDDNFGESVAVSNDGTTAIIGAYHDEDPYGDQLGSAYVFEVNGGSWTQQAKLSPNDGDRQDIFGESVTVSSDGTTAIIGAVGDEDPNGRHAGSAYVFEASGGSWTQQAKLSADDGDARDYFGKSVAVSNDGTTIIGARLDEDPNGTNAGSAYVFEASGGSWTQQAKLTPDDGDSNDLFGEAVAVSSDGTTAIIGAVYDKGPNGEKAGSAYVFESSGESWTQQANITPDNRDCNHQFGNSVAVSSDGNTAIIGDYFDEDPNGEDAGSAYVFEASGGSWTQQAKLAADDGDANDYFGNSVAVSSDGTTAVIGAHRDDDPNGRDAGSTYVFEATDGSWTQ